MKRERKLAPPCKRCRRLAAYYCPNCRGFICGQHAAEDGGRCSCSEVSTYCSRTTGKSWA